VRVEVFPARGKKGNVSSTGKVACCEAGIPYGHFSIYSRSNHLHMSAIARIPQNKTLRDQNLELAGWGIMLCWNSSIRRWQRRKKNEKKAFRVQKICNTAW
jgi:hypothetical protein